MGAAATWEGESSAAFEPADWALPALPLSSCATTQTQALVSQSLCFLIYKVSTATAPQAPPSVLGTTLTVS